MIGIRHESTTGDTHARIYIEGLERDLRILHLSDSHLTEADDRDPDVLPYAQQSRARFDERTPEGQTTREVFERTISDAREQGIDAAVLTGDIIHFPAWAGIECLEHGIKDLGVPALFTSGNHDWHFPYLEWSDAVRQSHYPRLQGLTGGNPACQSVDIGGVRLVTLDNSTYQVSDEQVSFLRSELGTGQPCLLFVHIPIWTEALLPGVMDSWKAPIMMCAVDDWTEETRSRWKVPGNDPSTVELYELLTQGESLNLAGIFCGHVHFGHAGLYHEGRWQYVARPGFSGGYRIIELLAVQSKEDQPGTADPPYRTTRSCDVALERAFL